MSALETPEAMAEDMVARIVRGELPPSMVLAIERAIRARDEQVTALCEARAAWLIDAVAADELRAIAAALRGAR